MKPFRSRLRSSWSISSKLGADGCRSAAASRLARLSGTLRPSWLLHRQVLARQARLCLAVGDLPTAEHWLLSRSKQRELPPRLQQEQENLIAARLITAQGKIEEALRLQQICQREAQQICQREAQQMGWTRSYLQILLRAGLPALDGSLAGLYIHTLLHAFAQSLPDEHRAAGPGRWSIASLKSDLLSPQERRVLALLLNGCSNPEMAQMLVVSINTIKTRVRSIYQKLNVKNRHQMRQAPGLPDQPPAFRVFSQ